QPCEPVDRRQHGKRWVSPRLLVSTRRQLPFPAGSCSPPVAVRHGLCCVQRRRSPHCRAGRSVREGGTALASDARPSGGRGLRTGGLRNEYWRTIQCPLVGHHFTRQEPPVRTKVCPGSGGPRHQGKSRLWLESRGEEAAKIGILDGR